MKFVAKLMVFKACAVSYYGLKHSSAKALQLDLNWCGRQGAGPHSFRRKNTVVTARPIETIVRLDQRWFRAHPERKHRCRWPDTGELALCDGWSRGPRLVIAIRHLGRGHVIYQPVIFQGMLPRDERSAGVLFALAAGRSEPIPFIDEVDVLRLRRGVPQHQQQACGKGCVA
jgi:hypothetical protein